ncbi:hypothetical protein [Paraburkholderia ribeironis]|uniref:hypothetical protein n=1 Tax=Paraburkholderia ribeironis TaxID=1247936 RepID=UPI0011784C21|nr:hypothetical protein [Paraburkholderia ribeironis]
MNPHIKINVRCKEIYIILDRLGMTSGRKSIVLTISKKMCVLNAILRNQVACRHKDEQITVSRLSLFRQRSSARLRKRLGKSGDARNGGLHQRLRRVRRLIDERLINCRRKSVPARQA